MSIGRAKRGAPGALVAVPLCALAIAGCGGSSGVTPAKYVKSICSALGVWKVDVQNAGTKLQSSGAGSASPPVAKSDYVRFVSTLRTATQGAATALKDAGTPAVSNGTDIANGLSGAFDRGAAGLVRAESQARAIPTGNPTVFEAGASSVTAEIRTALQGIATITPRKSAALRTAASREPACQVLNGP